MRTEGGTYAAIVSPLRGSRMKKKCAGGCKSTRSSKPFTIMNHFLLLSLAILLLLLLDTASGFYTPVPAGKLASTSSFNSRPTQIRASTSTTTTGSITILVQPARNANQTILRQSRPDVSGRDRGVPLLILACLGSLWFFTIPPEFRRAHICGNPICVENRAACYDCKTFGELKEEIVEYYQSGGGIQWDFTVDPNGYFTIKK